jgi:preprotein translocase subunit SecG
MATLILVIHTIVAVALIIIILLQPGKGGGMALGGGSQTVLDSADVSNFFTKATIVLGIVLFATSLSLAILGKHVISGTNDELLNQQDVPALESQADSEQNSSIPSMSKVPTVGKKDIPSVTEVPQTTKTK